MKTSDREGLGPNRPKQFFDLPASEKHAGSQKRTFEKLSVETLAKPVEGHATRRAQGSTRTEHRAWHDLSNAPGEHDVPQARYTPPLAALKQSAGLPSPMFPPTSLAAGVPAAHHPAETHNGLKPKRRGAEKRTGI